MKPLCTLFLGMVLISIAVAQVPVGYVGRERFLDANEAIESGDWNNPATWSTKTIPGKKSKVYFVDNVEVFLRGEAEIDTLSMGGTNRTGVLVIDGGSLKTLSPAWAAIGSCDSTLLKIINNGLLITSGRLYVGNKDDFDGSVAELLIDGGTVIVNGKLAIGAKFDGRARSGEAVFASGIITLRKGGLEAQHLIISRANGCRINLEEGRIVIFGNIEAAVKSWVAYGQLVAFNNAFGAVINATYDPSINKTIITASRRFRSLGLLY